MKLLHKRSFLILVFGVIIFIALREIRNGYWPGVIQHSGTLKLSLTGDQSMTIPNRHLSTYAKYDELKQRLSGVFQVLRLVTPSKSGITKNIGSVKQAPAITSSINLPPANCEKLHLITTYFNGIPTEHSTGTLHNVAKFFREPYRKFNDTQFVERNKEFIDTLQHNLNHPCVERIHVFYVEEKDLRTLIDSKLKNFQKLHPVKHERTLHMADFFIYASKNLIGKAVVAVNGDIELGEGFERIDVPKMLKYRLFYSLSRYERNISCHGRDDMCSSKYRGSHDCHVFALTKPLHEGLLRKKLDIPINMFQSENGMIYTMKVYFRFKVSNPCFNLKTYHNHCSRVHGPYNKSYSIFSVGWSRRQIPFGVARPTKL